MQELDMEGRANGLHRSLRVIANVVSRARLRRESSAVLYGRHGLITNWRAPFVALVIILAFLVSYANGIWAFAWSIEAPYPGEPGVHMTKTETARFQTMISDSTTVFYIREVPIVVCGVVAAALALRRKRPTQPRSD